MLKHYKVVLAQYLGYVTKPTGHATNLSQQVCNMFHQQPVLTAVLVGASACMWPSYDLHTCMWHACDFHVTCRVPVQFQTGPHRFALACRSLIWNTFWLVHHVISQQLQAHKITPASGQCSSDGSLWGCLICSNTNTVVGNWSLYAATAVYTRLCIDQHPKKTGRSKHYVSALFPSLTFLDYGSYPSTTMLV